NLDGRERVTPVAQRPANEVLDRVVVGGRALGVDAAAHEGARRVLVEGLEPEERRTAEQRRIHLEVRVLGGRADEYEQPRLDAREQRVLLRLVEPVDLVEEEDR